LPLGSLMGKLRSLSEALEHLIMHDEAIAIEKICAQIEEVCLRYSLSQRPIADITNVGRLAEPWTCDHFTSVLPTSIPFPVLTELSKDSTAFEVLQSHKAKDSRRLPDEVYRLLEDPASSGYIQWSLSGLSFTIFGDEASANKFLRAHLDGTNNVCSFTSRLKKFGFKQVKGSTRAQRGSSHILAEYKHPKFQRGRPDLLRQVHRSPNGHATENEIPPIVPPPSETLDGFSHPWSGPDFSFLVSSSALVSDLQPGPTMDSFESSPFGAFESPAYFSLDEGYGMAYNDGIEVHGQPFELWSGL